MSLTSRLSRFVIDLTRLRGRTGTCGLAALALVALATGCETIATTATPAAADQPTTTAAEQAERGGEYIIAAREYDRLAQLAPTAEAINYQLKAIENLLRAGELAQARVRLQRLATAPVDDTLGARRLLLQARLDQADGRHERAVRRLNQAMSLRDRPPALLAEIYLLRARAELALKNPIAAVRDLIARQPLVTGQEAITENQKELWSILQNLPVTYLRDQNALAGDPVLIGWLTLAQLYAENGGNTIARDAAIARWREAYPNHPATQGDLLEQVRSAAPTMVGRIDHIALLLPLTSNYAVAAQAVHDGFMAMHAADDAAEKPRVSVYDIGADPNQAAAFYALAVRNGAQIVIGPLGREATEALLRAGQLPVPTLLLSHVDDRPASGALLFQFGLPPEQEARQAAERAYLDGCRQAAVLTPESVWGERMYQAFTHQWQRLGNTVVTAQSFRDTDTDFSEPIKQMLLVSQSEQRRTTLERRLGMKLQFVARARGDIECIFLAADAHRGRLIKPQLNYHHAQHVPVYATSHIFTGKPDPVQDIDLDGVLFGDMPWLLAVDGRTAELKRRVQGEWPHARSDLDRLYALGVDSFALLPHLNRLLAESGERYPGVTSALSLDADGRLQRHLAWARFRNGVPQLLDVR